MTITSQHSACADQAYLHVLTDQPQAPHFILGCHRSGTTFLYQSLAGTGQFDFISPYDIVHYDRLLSERIHGGEAELRQRLQQELSGSSGSRGIDQIRVDAEQAEEYGFLLPKNPQQFLFSPQLLPATRERFMEICRKKQFLDSAGRPLLLKNPDDFYGNIHYLYEEFSASKIVLVHRHPLMVLNSQINAWTKMLEQKNPYFARLHPLYDALFDHPLELLKRRVRMKTPEGVRWMFSEFIKSFRYYCDHIGRMDADRVTSVRYEDLCADPEQELCRLADFLGARCQVHEFAHCLRRRRSSIVPLVRQVYDAMHEDVRFYLDAMEYETEPWELSN